MHADQILVLNKNGQRVRLIDEISNSLNSNFEALNDLFTLMAKFFDAVENQQILDLTQQEDLEAFEYITNLAGVVPFIMPNQQALSLRELNPSLSEKLYFLMLKVMRKQSSFIHKGTAFHNLGASQFSNRNTENALININEALRTDFFITNGNLSQVKSRPAFQVLTHDLKNLYGGEISDLIATYNNYFGRSYTTDQFLANIDSITRRGFLLKLFLYSLLDQYSLVKGFQQETFPTKNIRIPQNEYLLIKRYDCLRDCTLFFEELLRNVRGNPRMTSNTIKNLIDEYLNGRGNLFVKLKKILNFYWSKKKGSKKDMSLASFRADGYKTRQINNKYSRILIGNKSKLNGTNCGKLAKCLLLLGLMRNYTNHHLDLNCKTVKNTNDFEEAFKMSFYCIIFVVMGDSI